MKDGVDRGRTLEAREPAVPGGGVRRVADDGVAQALLDLSGGELGERPQLVGDPRAQSVEAGEAGAELGRGELGVEEHAAGAVDRAGQGLARRYRQSGGAEQAERDLLAERAQLVVGAVSERGSGEVEAAGVERKIRTHAPVIGAATTCWSAL